MWIGQVDKLENDISFSQILKNVLVYSPMTSMLMIADLLIEKGKRKNTICFKYRTYVSFPHLVYKAM